MKKIIIIVLTLIISINCNAQYSPHPAGSYTANPLLDRFVGTWLWTSGNDTMKIVLQKQVIHFASPFNYDEDALLGWHRYVKNGLQVESSLQFVGLPYGPNDHSTLFGGSNSYSVQRLIFKDITKNKTRNEVYFTMSRNSSTQATWQLSNSPGVRIRVNNEPAYNWGFTVPTNMVFTKQ